MIVSVAIAYALISCLFMLVGYVTTARDRLHLALSILASAVWPVSILVVASYVCGQRLAGIPFRHSGAAGEREGTPESIAARSPDDIVRRIRQPATHRAAN